MSHIDKAKIIDRLETLRIQSSGFASDYDHGMCKAFGVMHMEIASGAFDLIPMDVDVKEIEGMIWHNKHQDLSPGKEFEIFDLTEDCEKLLAKYIETLSQVERLKDQVVRVEHDYTEDIKEYAEKLNQALEALEQVKRATSKSEAYTDGARAHFIAHIALKSIKGANPYVETTPE